MKYSYCFDEPHNVFEVHNFFNENDTYKFQMRHHPLSVVL